MKHATTVGDDCRLVAFCAVFPFALIILLPILLLAALLRTVPVIRRFEEEKRSEARVVSTLRHFVERGTISRADVERAERAR